MVSFNNSIMIRNHAGDPVKSTAQLIETLKKVGIIKTKKRRAKRGLATSDEIRQDSDMGPGYAMPTPMPPPQFGGSPQQQDFNAQRIEDIQRQAGNQIALLRGRIQQLESAPTRFQPQQRIEQGQRGPQVEEMPSEERPIIIPDSQEFQGERKGPQPAQGSSKMGIDFDTTPTAIFVGDETAQPQAQAQAGPLTDDQKIAITIRNFQLNPIPNKSAKKEELVSYLSYLASERGLDQSVIIQGAKEKKERIREIINGILLDTYNGLPY